MGVLGFSITQPSGPTVLYQGYPFVIAWSYVVVGNYVNISLFDVAGLVLVQPIALTAANQTYTWVVATTVVAGNYSLRVSSPQNSTVYNAVNVILSAITNCTQGFYINVTATSTSNQVCAACASSSFSNTLNALTCTLYNWYLHQRQRYQYTTLFQLFWANIYELNKCLRVHCR
jgi:hypothetical protein